MATKVNTLLRAKDINEMLPDYSEILHQNNIREKFDYDNFASPESIDHFNESQLENSSKISSWRDTSIWKHNRVNLNYAIFRDVIN